MAGNPYQGMVGGLSAGETLGNVAMVSSLVACTVWPELLAPVPAAKSGLLLKYLGKLGAVDKAPMNKTIAFAGNAQAGGLLTSVPMRLMLIRTRTDQMMQAIATLYDSGEKGHTFALDLYDQIDSVTPTTWQAEDQAATSKRLSQFGKASLNTYCLEWDTALVMSIVCILRFAQLSIAAILAGILAALAIAYWAVVWIPFFGQGAAATIRGIGTVLAKVLRTVVRVMDEVMVKVALAAGSIVLARVAQAAVSDDMRLDTDGAGWGDLGESVIGTLDDMVKKYNKLPTAMSGF